MAKSQTNDTLLAAHSVSHFPHYRTDADQKMNRSILGWRREFAKNLIAFNIELDISNDPVGDISVFLDAA
jgi:hypothetical protein